MSASRASETDAAAGAEIRGEAGRMSRCYVDGHYFIEPTSEGLCAQFMFEVSNPYRLHLNNQFSDDRIDVLVVLDTSVS
jgi:hypothetical protein